MQLIDNSVKKPPADFQQYLLIFSTFCRVDLTVCLCGSFCKCADFQHLFLSRLMQLIDNSVKKPPADFQQYLLIFSTFCRVVLTVCLCGGFLNGKRKAINRLLQTVCFVLKSVS
jgi:predicted nucleotidyltransferase